MTEKDNFRGSCSYFPGSAKTLVGERWDNEPLFDSILS